MKIKKGFTLIELLVVMVIIAVLAGLLMPAVRKSRSKALVDKANAEMAALASVVTMAKLDCGYYVRLCDLASHDTSIITIKYLKIVESPASASWEVPDTGTPLVHISNWDGPYQVFQDKGVLGGAVGTIPTDNTGTWDLSPTGDDFPAASSSCKGTPLDPWGRAYAMSYSLTDKVMVVYSAGPNGRLETGDGVITIPTGSDDIIYKFR